MSMIRVGEAAPDFELPLHTGERFRLSEQRGNKIVVLYFYPQDFTFSCTREACSFRENHTALLKYGALVIGISPDDLDTHKRFANTHRLNFPLASDTTLKVSKRFGAVWFGGLRIKRISVVIDRQGIVRGIFHHELLVDNHRKDIVQLLDTLQTEISTSKGTAQQ